MDVALRRFLDSVRPRSRPAHLATYEDVAFALDCFLRSRRRTARSLRAGELRSFLGYWYLRHYRPLSRGRARRFCAALRVLVGWLCAERAPERGRTLRAEMTRVARQTARAARASELLDALAPAVWSGAEMPVEDGYWEILLRSDSHVVLRALGAASPIGPVLLPPEVVRALAPGDILNLQLLDLGHAWRVLDHGLCYPPVAAPALRAANLAPA